MIWVLHFMPHKNYRDHQSFSYLYQLCVVWVFYICSRRKINRLTFTKLAISDFLIGRFRWIWRILYECELYAYIVMIIKKGFIFIKKKRERTLVTHIDRIFPWFVSLILTFVSLMIRIAFFFLSHCLLFFRTNALTSDFSYFLFHVKLKKRWISKQRNGG